jgi:hypothetical protein
MHIFYTHTHTCMSLCLVFICFKFFIFWYYGYSDFRIGINSFENIPITAVRIKWRRDLWLNFSFLIIDRGTTGLPCLEWWQAPCNGDFFSPQRQRFFVSSGCLMHVVFAIPAQSASLLHSFPETTQIRIAILTLDKAFIKLEVLVRSEVTRDLDRQQEHTVTYILLTNTIHFILT